MESILFLYVGSIRQTLGKPSCPAGANLSPGHHLISIALDNLPYPSQGRKAFCDFSRTHFCDD
jgi:hypothetical protein